MNKFWKATGIAVESAPSMAKIWFKILEPRVLYGELDPATSRRMDD